MISVVNENDYYFIIIYLVPHVIVFILLRRFFRISSLMRGGIHIQLPFPPTCNVILSCEFRIPLWKTDKCTLNNFLTISSNLTQVTMENKFVINLFKEAAKNPCLALLRMPAETWTCQLTTIISQQLTLH